MTYGPFIAPYEQLPETLPIFPLPGAIVMPCLEADWNMLERLSTVSLMNSLSMALPISEQDKQMLLETVEATQQLRTINSLLGSGFQAPRSVTRH